MAALLSAQIRDRKPIPARRHPAQQGKKQSLLWSEMESFPRQCDKEFKGLIGECPTCHAMIERADRTTAAATPKHARSAGTGQESDIDPSIRNKRGCGALAELQLAHPRGYWEGVECRDCRTPDQKLMPFTCR